MIKYLMKKKRILITAGILVLVLLITFLVKAIKLDLFVSRDSIKPEQLTQKQKIEDFKYFYQLIRDSYPFVEAIEKEKGLDNFYELEDHYHKLIKKSKNNKEFINIIAEMLQRLEQGTAHCDIIAPGKKLTEYELWSDCLVYNVSKKGFYLKKYWWDLLDLKSKRFHSNLQTIYEDGKYVVNSPYETDDIIILEGSIIESINGIPVDKYIKSLQNILWLRFDIHKQKLYSHHSPFLANPDKDKSYWEVTLKFPDNTLQQVNLKKFKGYQPPPGVKYPKENVTCVELNKKTGYIRVNAFIFKEVRKADFKKIECFFQQSKGKYKTLIIDIRGNLGGAPAYWEKIFIERLIKEPRQHKQYSIVKKKVFDKLNFYNKLFAHKYREEINYGKLEKVEMDEFPYELPEYINPEQYYLLKNTKKYTPKNSFPFEGKIYMLIDHDTFSAAEDFSKAAKELKFAKLVGANTIGGAAVSFAPWVFELPNSHIMMNIEIDMAFNKDGSINEIYGTKPHHMLQPSTYPTTMPEAYDQKSLLKDNWIKFILEKEK